MLTERNLAANQRALDRRKLGGSQVFLAQKPVYRTGAGRGQEHSLGIGPAVSVGRAGANIHRTRGAEGDQFVRVDRQIVFGQWAGVFQKVARHPVVLTGSRDVTDLLAEVVAEELSAPFAG